MTGRLSALSLCLLLARAAGARTAAVPRVEAAVPGLGAAAAPLGAGAAPAPSVFPLSAPSLSAARISPAPALAAAPFPARAAALAAARPAALLQAKLAAAAAEPGTEAGDGAPPADAVFDGAQARREPESSVPADADGPAAPGLPAAARPAPGERQGLKLGVLARPAARLHGRIFTLGEWQYLSFSVVAEGAGGLGEATIDGRPAAESPLEFKHTVRAVVEGGKALMRHDYGVLAIGATPQRAYGVSFAAGPVSFFVSVEKTDHRTPEERAESAKKLIREAFSRKDEPSIDFAPGVPEMTRRLFEPHHAIMGRLLERYRRYLEEDEVRDEALERRRADLASLEAFYADVAAGRVRYEAAPLAAQLLAREGPLLREYRDYLLADPATGRVSAEMQLEQIDDYREVLEKLRGAFARIDESREPGAFARAIAGAIGLWAKFRAWLATRGWL